MRNLSVLIFGAAIAMGLLTVFLARSYINNQRMRPNAIVQTEGDTAEMGTLVVAALPLNFGDEITVESLKEVPWPLDPELRPENSFAQIADVMSGDRRVAIRSLAKSEPVVQSKISGFGYRATLSQVVDPTMRAAAIRVNDVTGVGGFVLPGDRVDVVYTQRDRQDIEKNEARLIIRDVRVLAIDQVADESTGGAVVAKAATLEVSQEQAQKLSLASRTGELDLMLRPMTADGDVLDEDMDTIRVADLVNDNGAAIKPTPVVFTGRRTTRIARPAPAPAPDPFATMTVTRGLQTTSSEVPKADTLDDADTLAGGATIAQLGTNAASAEYPNP